jgi:hypothetical protein
LRGVRNRGHSKTRADAARQGRRPGPPHQAPQCSDRSGLLVYPARQSLNDLVNAALARPPEIDSSRRTASGIALGGGRAGPNRVIQRESSRCRGSHRRWAPSQRGRRPVYRSRQGAGQSPWYLNVIFPDDQVRILPTTACSKP